MNTHSLYDKAGTRVADGRKGVIDEAGGREQHNITEAAPNELNVGEGRRSDQSRPSARR